MKTGDYIWHRAGPVGYGVVTGISGSGYVSYTMLRHANPFLHQSGDFYTCKALDEQHMRVVTEEEVLRILLGGADVEIEEAPS